MSEVRRSYKKPIQIDFPLYIKGLKLTFWMRSFEIEDGIKTLKVNVPNSSLYLQLQKGYEVMSEMSADNRKSLSFGISQFNLKDVQECFKIALSWFNQENRSELYGKMENGVLIFNSSYSGLNSTFIDKYASVQGGIKITPTITEVGVNMNEPAVILYINKKENYVLLREYEFKRLANAIIDFNFIAYDQFALSCIDYCKLTGNIIGQDEINKRLDYQRQFNSNYKR